MEKSTGMERKHWCAVLCTKQARGCESIEWTVFSANGANGLWNQSDSTNAGDGAKAKQKKNQRGEWELCTDSQRSCKPKARESEIMGVATDAEIDIAEIIDETDKITDETTD